MNTNFINKVDIVIGLAWGDEGKGKIVSYLSKNKNYDFVCRYNGGNNAGHTIYINDIKYKTHLIPSGIFYGIKCVIGPDCVVNIHAFQEEIDYLKSNGFDTSLIKVSPKAHIITDKHIQEDILKYSNQGTTSKGIAPCYRDKYARIGKQVKDEIFFKDYLWDEKLYGNVLCEGAQGVWLDIDHGNYPYTTSSVTMPYNACSLGFSLHLIKNIYGAVKIYDTRSGIDPLFPEELFNNESLNLLVEYGKEYGTTTNRKRKCNWLNLDKLLQSINISGTTDIIISKIDIIKQINIFKLFYDNELKIFKDFNELQTFINEKIKQNCKFVNKIYYSDNVNSIKDL